MARPLVLMLTLGQRAELEKARDTHLRPYMRERCAALLKVTDGGGEAENGASLLQAPPLWSATDGGLLRSHPRSVRGGERAGLGERWQR